MAALQTRAPLEQKDALGETLALVAGRVRSQRRIRGGVRGLLVALAVDILLAGLSRAALLPDDFPLFPILVIVAGIGAALSAVLSSRSVLTPMDAARLAEASQPLKERLSSALEFSHAPLSPLLGLQHADAEAHACALNTRQVVPRRLPREAWLVPPLLLALALMLCLPSLPFGPSPAQRAEQNAVRLAGRQLAQAAHQAAQQADAQHQPEAKRQAQKMEALGKRMAQGHMDRAQALAAVSKQEQQLAQAGQTASNAPSDPGQAAKDLARASQSPTSSSSQSSASRQGAAASAKQSGPNTALPSSGSGVSPAAPRAGTSAANNGGSPHQQTTQAKAASGQQPSAPAAPSTPEAQQALENARRQLAGSSPASSPAPAKPNPASQQPSSSALAKSGSPPKPGTSGKPGASGKPSASSTGKPNSSSTSSTGKPASPSAAQPGKPNSAAPSNGSKSSRQNQASTGKPGGQGSSNNGKPNGQGQSGADKPNGQSQGSGGKPGGTSTGSGRTNSTSAQPGKGHGQPGQGSPGRQNGGSPSGAPGTPAPGGGAGPVAKAPFHSVLPPTAASKSQGIYLGTPRAGDGQGKMLPKQSGLPSAPAEPSRVPYGLALPRYRKRAEAALDQEQVPPSQRAVVRRYFNSLQPAK